jgi:hypothetical protein
MQQASCNASYKIEKQIANMPKRVLHIVPENIQEQHVSAQMDYVRVQEH